MRTAPALVGSRPIAVLHWPKLFDAGSASDQGRVSPEGKPARNGNGYGFGNGNGNGSNGSGRGYGYRYGRGYGDGNVRGGGYGRSK